MRGLCLYITRVWECWIVWTDSFWRMPTISIAITLCPETFAQNIYIVLWRECECRNHKVNFKQFFDAKGKIKWEDYVRMYNYNKVKNEIRDVEDDIIIIGTSTCRNRFRTRNYCPLYRNKLMITLQTYDQWYVFVFWSFSLTVKSYIIINSCRNYLLWKFWQWSCLFSSCRKRRVFVKEISSYENLK